MHARRRARPADHVPAQPAVMPPEQQVEAAHAPHAHARCSVRLPCRALWRSSLRRTREHACTQLNFGNDRRVSVQFCNLNPEACNSTRYCGPTGLRLRPGAGRRSYRGGILYYFLSSGISLTAVPEAAPYPPYMYRFAYLYHAQFGLLQSGSSFLPSRLFHFSFSFSVFAFAGGSFDRSSRPHITHGAMRTWA